MKAQFFALLAFLNFVSFSAPVLSQAASDEVQVLSLNEGIYDFEISQNKDTVFIELEQMDLTKPGKLGLQSELSLHVGSSRVGRPLDVFQIAQVSTTELLTRVSEGGAGSPQKMKKGTVKFFNDAKGMRLNGEDMICKSQDGECSFLVLPVEIQRVIQEAQAQKLDVILILRFEVQEGKKGLNAVNVKLA